MVNENDREVDAKQQQQRRANMRWQALQVAMSTDHELDARDTQVKAKMLASQTMLPAVVSDGVAQAVYTSGTKFSTPLSTAQYYHRNLNPKKNVEIGFSYLPRGMSMDEFEMYYRLPENPCVKGFRLMREDDIDGDGVVVVVGSVIWTTLGGSGHEKEPRDHQVCLGDSGGHVYVPVGRPGDALRTGVVIALDFLR